MDKTLVTLSLTLEESVVVVAGLRMQSNRLRESAKYVLGNNPNPVMEALANEALQDSLTMRDIAKRVEKATNK